MGASSTLGLLFEIDADPSKAQQALATFEAAAGEQFQRIAGNAKNVAQEATRFEEDLQHPDKPTVLPGDQQFAQQVQGMAQTLRSTLVPAYNMSSEAAKNFGQVVTESFARITDASHSATAAEAARMAATLGFRRAAAAIEAVWETAKGFAALGDWDFWAAAQHFMAAAEYGIIAGTGGGGGSRSVGTGAGGPSAGGRPSQTGSQPGQAINVYVQGMISPDNLQQVIAQINQQVTNKGTTLVATTTTQPPTVRGLR